jgi:diketogulonate reductase-like aldo/keto reductase
MRTLRLPSGQAIPVLGLGTWGLGERFFRRRSEIAALRYGLDLGMCLIDTAEIYSGGWTEKLIAQAIAKRRADVFLVDKIHPDRATRSGTITACEESLRRLKTDYLDLYLLHWRGSAPLSDTLEAFQVLKQAGKIRDYGMSNFDLAGMQEARQLPGGAAIATNQVRYNLMYRNVEADLLPWCREQQMPLMAYSPVERGQLLKDDRLHAFAQQRGVTTAQMAIAWLLHQDNVVVIPKASSVAHVKQNYAALTLQLSAEELVALDAAFPPSVHEVAK